MLKKKFASHNENKGVGLTLYFTLYIKLGIGEPFIVEGNNRQLFLTASSVLSSFTSVDILT